MTGQSLGWSWIARIPPMLDGFKSTWVIYTVTLCMFFPSIFASSNCASGCKKNLLQKGLYARYGTSCGGAAELKPHHASHVSMDKVELIAWRPILEVTMPPGLVHLKYHLHMSRNRSAWDRYALAPHIAVLCQCRWRSSHRYVEVTAMKSQGERLMRITKRVIKYIGHVETQAVASTQINMSIFLRLLQSPPYW